ncbi:MAG: PepSY-associated TM helix domain-containing protein [Alphaproteobacteria bacterium]
MTTSDTTPVAHQWPDVAAVWRWHFYAGLFCIPFVIWLSLTGSLYVFKPQIEALIDAPYDTLPRSGPDLAPSAWVTAALATVPGARIDALEVPPTAASAPRVLLRRNGDLVRVYVHPETAAVLKVVNEDDRLMKQIAFLHGKLGVGDPGSWLVETAACWTLVMLLTGVYLWWPRTRAGLAGVLMPRLTAGQRTFWRDLHAVTGIWICLLAVFLILSGLPWAKNWGGYLKEVRQLTGTADGPQDWSTGRAGERRARMEADAGGHAAHAPDQGTSPMALQAQALDRLVPEVPALGLAPPVLVSPPTQKTPAWTIRSEAQNRTLRSTLSYDPVTLELIGQRHFADRHPIDRIVGVGISAHEGQLFGWPNQVLSLLAAFGLLLLSTSAVVLWWRRRPQGTLGAPAPRAAPRLAAGLVIIVAVLGVLFPLFGASLIAILALERALLQRFEASRTWLGLRTRHQTPSP